MHAPEHHRAEYRIVLPRGARQQLRPGNVEEARCPDSQRSRTLAHAPGELRIEHPARLEDIAAVSVNIHLPERRGRLRNISKNLPEERFMVVSPERLTNVGDKIAERQYFRQLRFPTF